MHKTKMTLANICSGAVQEKVDRAMEQVARNILDPNTSNKEARVITLKITFKPKEDDVENVTVSAAVQTKLAGENGVTTDMFISSDIGGDRIHIMEHRRGEIRGQLDFSDIYGDESEMMDPEEAQQIVDFRRKKEV